MTATAAGRVIDLDAARSARAEAQAEPVVLRFGGNEYQLPPELPADFAFLAAEEKVREAVAALLGDDADAFFAARPSLADLTALAEAAGDVYGVEPGEARASAGS